eukprot:Seg841.7 transcript_id=Seg841.7/GoldUCD/mRNA.D3Y31 product="hypothetical protein" protein_id=Seg841.7/GoldUCD/D3Y31
MAAFSSTALRRLLTARNTLCTQSRSAFFMRKKLVTREEYLKLSRTAAADYESILRKLNLSEHSPSMRDGPNHEIKLLRNVNSELEYKYVRPGRSYPVYYRLDLVMQRVNYMSTMGITSKEKLSILRKKPPVLVLCKHQMFDSSSMVYLRGIHKEGQASRYIFHPLFPRVSCRKPSLDNRLEMLCESLKATKEQVLEITIGLPCFSIDSSCLEKYKEQIILLHRTMLPQEYDVDSVTFDIYPPIFSGLQNLHLFDHQQNDIPSLTEYELSDILDVSYTSFNGKGNPEGLTEFLLRAYDEEIQYNTPVNFKAKKIPRKHRRFLKMKPLPPNITLTI